MPDLSFRGPFCELDFRDQTRFDPSLGARQALGPAAGLLHLVGERRSLSLQSGEFCFERASFFPAPAGSDTADRHQFTGCIVYTEYQAADLPRPTAAIRVADDDEFLPLFAFELEPGFRAARLVRRIGALRDDALEVHTARRFENRCGIGIERFTEA